MTTTADRPARHFLYEKLARDLDYALANAGGSGSHGGHRDTDAWRSMDRAELVEHVMTFLQAGLGPALDADAVEAGTRVARRILAENTSQQHDGTLFQMGPAA